MVFFVFLNRRRRRRHFQRTRRRMARENDASLIFSAKSSTFGHTRGTRHNRHHGNLAIKLFTVAVVFSSSPRVFCTIYLYTGILLYALRARACWRLVASSSGRAHRVFGSDGISDSGAREPNTAGPKE